MKKYTTGSEFVKRQTPPETTVFVKKNLAITEQVYAYLEEKRWSQKEFAKKLGKTDAEVSKWLSGMHNLTLKSIAKMEAVLEKEIVLTPYAAKKEYHRVHYVTMKVHAPSNRFSAGRYTNTLKTEKSQIVTIRKSKVS